MTPDSVRLSKALSYWLRHKPDAASLELDSRGWTDVDAVLRAFAKQGDAVDWEGLLHLVESSDKRRFELSPDAGQIRARQGHTVEVEGDWAIAEPPEILWHGTVARFLPSILAEGLKPMGRHHVHLSDDPRTAELVAKRRGAPVILIVEALRLAREGQAFYVTGNGVWLTESVRPEALRSQLAL